ncbi:YfhE family protein [Aquibacillus sediminis]|nr:YfhE family protein [Aquibacillus sediminis]
MRGKSQEYKQNRTGLSKTQEVLYQKEFKAANRLYDSTKKRV